MTAITLNRLLRSSRRRVACLTVMLALGAAVVVHHTPSNHMGMGQAMVMCIALLPAVALAVAAVIGGLLSHRRPRLVVTWPSVRRSAPAPLPRARSSPVRSVVLRL